MYNTGFSLTNSLRHYSRWKRLEKADQTACVFGNVVSFFFPAQFLKRFPARELEQSGEFFQFATQNVAVCTHSTVRLSVRAFHGQPHLLAVRSRARPRVFDNDD